MASDSRDQRGHPFLAFLLLSVCGGLVLSCMAVPGLALTIGASNLAASNLQNLPQALVTPPQPEGSTVYLADGSVLTNFSYQNRSYVTLDQIAPVMQQAQVDIEDRRFYQHGAVDMQGMVRAAITQLLGGQQQGASTLTQQYVKLVRQQIALDANDPVALKEATDDTLSRKIIEMRYAIAVEQQLSKQQILERYLNLAYYGDGCYGVEAAAEYYFGATAATLTLGQAAMLAGLVQNPSTTDPVNHTSAAIARAGAVLDAMVSVGDITTAQATQAKQEVAAYDPSVSVHPFDNGCADSSYPFICDYVKKILVSDQMPGLGSTPDERENQLERGGLQITTLIDPTIQNNVQAAISNLVAPTDPVISAVAEIQPGTGNIVAMAQSRPYGNNMALGQTNYNYVVDNNMGGAQGFQAGSTFKIFTLAQALSMGAPYDTLFPAPASMTFTGQTVQTCSGPMPSGTYAPHNVNGMSFPGYITLLKALQQSVNTYFVQLEQYVGLCGVVKMAQAAGMVLAMPGTGGSTDLIAGGQADQKLSFTLGSLGISPLREAEAYATFAAGGVHCSPIILKSVTTRDGGDVPVPSANCQQTIDARVAADVSYGLVQVGLTPGASILNYRIPGGYPQAMKTGTTDSVQTEWVAGYTPELATAAVVAADTAPKSPLNIWGWNADGTSKATLTGLKTSLTRFTGSSGHDAGQVWQPAMVAGLNGAPKTDFPPFVPIQGNWTPKYSPAPTATATPSAAAPTDSGAAAAAAPPPGGAPGAVTVTYLPPDNQAIKPNG